MTEPATICPKCAYERTATDAAPPTECPNCGVIYAKVSHIVAKPRVIRPATPPVPETPPAATHTAEAQPSKPKNPPPASALATCDTCDGKVSPRAKTCPHCGDPIHAEPDAPARVTLTDIEIPFWTAVMFMVRWAFATIPAVIIVFIVVMIVSMFFGGLGQFFVLMNRH